MKRAKTSSRKHRANGFVLVEGEIVDVTRKAIKFSQQFCRCGNFESCVCSAREAWIPKSLIRRNSFYETNAATSAGLTLWQKGAARFLIPCWKFNEITKEMGLAS